MNPKEIKKTAYQLENKQTHFKAIVGFDGFIDSIIHLVQERTSVDKFKRLNTMKDLAARIDAAAGKSANIEAVVRHVKLGGNGPIMANALINLDFPVTYIGAIGAGKVHHVFRGFAQRCEQVIGLAEPGLTDALEFLDGKIMLGKMTTMQNVNWTNLKQQMPEAQLHQLFGKTALLAMVNWTMLAEMNSILEGVTQIFSESHDRKTVFIDLADPRKRPVSELRETLKIISNMQRCADVILGLNESESVQVCNALQIPDKDNLQERADRVLNQMQIKQVVIHPIKEAVSANENGTAHIEGPYAQDPVLTTGAGDNFNAGYCLGYLSGLSLQQCLITGVSASGFYVRNGKSANRTELCRFMHNWADNKIDREHSNANVSGEVMMKG